MRLQFGIANQLQLAGIAAAKPELLKLAFASPNSVCLCCSLVLGLAPITGTAALSICADFTASFGGSGVPSSSFGAATGNPGFWNNLNGLPFGRFGNRVEQAPFDNSGNPTSATILVPDADADDGVGDGPPAIDNDEKLFKDYLVGSDIILLFKGLPFGIYDIFTCTYRDKTPFSTQVTVAGETQVVTPPNGHRFWNYWVGHNVLATPDDVPD